jgi:ribosomal protein L11 methyltransferase
VIRKARSAGSSAFPDRWLELTTSAGPPGEVPLLVDALRRVGARTVERAGERVVALFPPPPDPQALLAEAASVIRASTSVADPELSWQRRSHADWAAAWCAAHPPERVAGRLVVAPTGTVWRGSDDLVIRLHPAVAFGTAEHPTTRACLRMLAGHLPPDARVLDVGAGSGVLSIAAALLGAARVLALEHDPLACAAAEENAAASGVADLIDVRRRRVVSRDFGRFWPPGGARLRRDGPFDAILANLDATAVLRLLPGFRAVLAPTGWLAISGVVRVERTAVLEAAANEGLVPADEEMEGGWWSARLCSSGSIPRARPPR